MNISALGRHVLIEYNNCEREKLNNTKLMGETGLQNMQSWNKKYTFLTMIYSTEKLKSSASLRKK